MEIRDTITTTFDRASTIWVIIPRVIDCPSRNTRISFMLYGRCEDELYGFAVSYSSFPYFLKEMFKFYIAKLAKLDVYFPLFRNPKNQASPDFRAH